MTQKSVKIYSTPTCTYCKQAKEFFDENNIKYKDFDVTRSEEAREEMIDKTGQMGVPVILINEKVIIGFDKEKIKKALGM